MVPVAATSLNNAGWGGGGGAEGQHIIFLPLKLHPVFRTAQAYALVYIVTIRMITAEPWNIHAVCNKYALGCLKNLLAAVAYLNTFRKYDMSFRPKRCWI